MSVQFWSDASFIVQQSGHNIIFLRYSSPKTGLLMENMHACRHMGFKKRATKINSERDNIYPRLRHISKPNACFQVTWKSTTSAQSVQMFKDYGWQNKSFLMKCRSSELVWVFNKFRLPSNSIRCDFVIKKEKIQLQHCREHSD